MKVIYKNDKLKKEYEVYGVVIYRKENVKEKIVLFLLENGNDDYYNKFEIIDNRIPFNWHMKVICNDDIYYSIIGFKELTYSIDLIDWYRQGCSEAVYEMKKCLIENRKKMWQKELDYYDENLNYTNIMEEMRYKFSK